MNSISLYFFQECSEVFESLRDGNFGPCEDQLNSYKQKLHKRFQYALLFKDEKAEPNENHVNELLTTVDDLNKTADL